MMQNVRLKNSSKADRWYTLASNIGPEKIVYTSEQYDGKLIVFIPVEDSIMDC